MVGTGEGESLPLELVFEWERICGKAPKAGSHSKFSSAFVSGGGWGLGWTPSRTGVFKVVEKPGLSPAREGPRASGPLARGHLSWMGSAQLCIVFGLGKRLRAQPEPSVPISRVPQLPDPTERGLWAPSRGPGSAQPGSWQCPALWPCLTCPGLRGAAGSKEWEVCWSSVQHGIRNLWGKTARFYLGMTPGARICQQEGRRGSSAKKWRPQEVVGAGGGVRWNPGKHCWEHWTRGFQ